MGPYEQAFDGIFKGLIFIGVIIGLLVAGLIFGGCKLISKYQIKIDKKPISTNVVYITNYVTGK